MTESRKLAIAIVRALDAKKASDIQMLRTEDVTTLADYFIIATAHSTTQLKTLADESENMAETLGEKVHHIEGYREGGWVLLDFSSVVVHVFMPEERERYNLEHLWSDASQIDISDYLTEN